jgi:Bacterial protein of unknown function (DUF948)
VVASISWGGIAAIVAAGAWLILAIALSVVLFNLFAVLASTKVLIDGIRQETVPLLGEVTTTVTSLNKELERVDGMLESAGNMVRSAERLTNVVENAVSSPLVKVASFGAGLSRAVRRFRKR